MILTIHQPNFIPWLPFFLKMASADVFILLRHCQYEKSGFQNRFNRAGIWYTLPTKKDGSQSLIVDKLYVELEKNWSKIHARLSAIHPTLGRILDGWKESGVVTPSLANTNEAIIRDIAARLGIKTRIEQDFPTSDTRDDRLIALCKKYGADTYLAGPSGPKYMEARKWREAGIRVEVQTVEEGEKRCILDVLADEEMKNGKL